jgi:preprotein translocase subunit SecG
MYSFLVVIMIIIAILLILAVLVQRSKGGGFSSSVNANQFMGVQKGTDFIEKTTWTLAISLFALCLLVSIIIKNQGPAEQKGLMDDVNKEAPAPQQPAAPNNTTTPTPTPTENNTPAGDGNTNPDGTPKK